MKNISLQWRITIMTSLLIAISCISMNLLMFRSGSDYMDSLGGYVTEYSQNSEDSIYINIPDTTMDSFLKRFSEEIYQNKLNFSQRGWLITAIISLISGIIAYYISGRSLKPLKELSENIEQIQAKNLTDSKLEENNVKEFNILIKSFNQMLDRLSNSFKGQRKFTANAAHELRTPLAIMQSQIDLIEEDAQALTKENKEFISMLKKQIDKLNSIINILLDLSELESVKRENKIELSALFDEIITDLYPLAEASKINIENKLTENIFITGSDILIYRLFYNIIENAIKYNKEGGKISINSKNKANKIEISIKDSGIGMEKNKLDEIFKPFYRIDKYKNTQINGVGLGLALVDEIVRLHGGKIIVNSEPGQGTEFIISLKKINFK